MSFDRTSSFSILLYLFSFIHSISCITSPIETYRISFTAAIYKQIVPSSYAMRKIALDADVYNQMIILNMIPSNTNVDDILKYLPSERLFWTKDNYKTYDCEIGFFYDAHPDQKPLWQVLDQFSTHLQIDSHSLIDPNTATTFSMDNQASNGIFVNTSQITITPATFSIQRCADGSAVSGEQTCPEIDPALIPAAAKTSTSSTTQLLTIIVPIIGGVVVIALIIVAIIIVRRRQANKVMRQNIQQNEADVEVNMA